MVKKFAVPHLLFEEQDTLNAIDDLRTRYLDGLIEPQELYLEFKIREARVFVIQSDNQRIGYFLLGEDADLLEYFVNQEFLHEADTILEKVIRKFSVRKALCKSFDHTLLSCCAGLQNQVNVLGVLFREYREEIRPPVREGVTCRPANAEDERHIIEINEEVFDHDEEVMEYIRDGKVFLFEKGQEMIGFGIFARVIVGRPAFDIGMLVERKYRRQGYGEYIIRYLTYLCAKNGWRATCGCAVENEASRRCLEKAGFISRYRLLEFVF